MNWVVIIGVILVVSYEVLIIQYEFIDTYVVKSGISNLMLNVGSYSEFK